MLRRRLALPAALATVTLGLASLATPAWAILLGTPEGNSDAVFTSSTTGTITLQYECGDDADPTAVTSGDIYVGLDQSPDGVVEGATASGLGGAVLETAARLAVRVPQAGAGCLARPGVGSADDRAVRRFPLPLSEGSRSMVA